MHILITGATGTAGSGALQAALAHPKVTRVTALNRRPTGMAHPKLHEILHTDFQVYNALASVFSTVDACIWALGISQTQVSRAELDVITHDYALAAAHALLQANSRIAFVFLSGQGADPSGKSRAPFARAKGRTETDLAALPFARLHMARPGGIVPTRRKPNSALPERLLLAALPLLRLVAPNSIISTQALGEVLVELALGNGPTGVLEQKDLLQFAPTR